MLSYFPQEGTLNFYLQRSLSIETLLLAYDGELNFQKVLLQIKPTASSPFLAMLNVCCISRLVYYYQMLISNTNKNLNRAINAYHFELN